MTLEQVQKAMKEATFMRVSDAQKRVKTIPREDQQKLINAAEEAGGWAGLRDKLSSLYQVLEDPKDVIMEGNSVKNGVAALLILMVIEVRAHGLRVWL